MTICSQPHAHMIKTDGGLWHGSSMMVPDLEKIGWRQVINPKRPYYPEYDKTSPSFREQEVMVVDERIDSLEVEKL